MRYAVELHDLIKLKIEAANLTELDILGLIEIAKEIKAHAEAKKIKISVDKTTNM